MRDEVWTVEVVEHIRLPKPDTTGMSVGEAFVTNIVTKFTVGGTFARYKIRGASLIDVAAIAAKQMDESSQTASRAMRCRLSTRTV